MSRMKRITAPLFVALLSVMMIVTSSCDNHKKFTIKGTVADASGQTLYLEYVGISSVDTLDSVKLTGSGKFKFKHDRPDYPDFYRLLLKNQFINIAIDSIETITVNADAGTFATSYTVEGSDNCKAIKEITLAQLDANQAINKLRKEYDAHQITDTAYAAAVQNAANSYKNVAIKYIYTAPMTTAAYFGLFQQVNGLLFFDLYDKTDSKAYGAVATSFDHFYHDSPRSKQLYNLALQSIKVIRAQRDRAIDLPTNVKTQEIGYVDIALPDINGRVIRLSQIVPGKLTIVNFTAYSAERSSSFNMSLGDLYTKYASSGLQIYQISLDTDVNLWKNIASKLPWLCVRDPESAYSQIAALYNVHDLPALFVIDKQGNLVNRFDNFTDLERAIKSHI